MANKENVLKFIKFFKEGTDIEEIRRVFNAKDSKDIEALNKQIEALEKEGRIYAVDILRRTFAPTQKVLDEEKELEARDQEEGSIKKVSFVQLKGGFCEEVYDPETKQAKFCCFYEDSGKVEISDEVRLDGDIYLPINDDALITGAILLPVKPETFTDISNLIEDIKKHFHKYLDINDDFMLYASYYVLLSWNFDKFTTVPYLRALGDTGTGKSRFLDVIGDLLYKRCKISGAVTPAPIYRLMRKWKGSLIIDEADFKDSDTYNDVITILNCGFEKNKPVMRCNMEDPDNIEFYDCFGTKIISSRYTFKDKALESRCLTEKMRQTIRKDIPPILLSKYEKERQHLINKLLMFRFNYRNKIDPETIETMDLGDIEPRLKQGMAAFGVLFANIPYLFDQFKGYLLRYQDELIEERSSSFEGMIVNALYDIVNIDNISTDEISAKDIATKLNETSGSKKFETSSQQVGKYLKTLGLKTKGERVGKGFKRVLDMDDESLLVLLFKRYVSPMKLNVIGSSQGQSLNRFVSDVSSVSNIEGKVTNDTLLVDCETSEGNKQIVSSQARTYSNDTNDTADTEQARTYSNDTIIPTINWNRKEFNTYKNIILEMCDGANVPIEDITAKFADQEVSWTVVQKMITDGLLFEVRPGIVRRL